jgi:hypothetical protein
MGNFLGSEDVPSNVIATAFDSAQNYRSPIMMDYLLFGIYNPNNSLITNVNTIGFTTSTRSLVNLVGAATSAFIPTMSVSTPPSQDMSGPWIVPFSGRYRKNDTRNSLLTFTVTGRITASTMNAGALAGIVVLFYQNGVVTSYLDFKSLITFPIDSTQVGVNYSITDTAPLYFLNQVSVGTQYSIAFEVYIISSTTPNAGQSATVGVFGGSYSIQSVSVPRNVYLDPTINYPWGAVNAMCLCDDLTHEMDIVF